MMRVPHTPTGHREDAHPVQPIHKHNHFKLQSDLNGLYVYVRVTLNSLCTVFTGHHRSATPVS